MAWASRGRDLGAVNRQLAQSVDFDLKLLRSDPYDIAEANDADEPIVVEHGKTPNPTLRHRARDAAQRRLSARGRTDRGSSVPKRSPQVLECHALQVRG